MYIVFLNMHSALRWLLLIVLVGASINYIIGWLQKGQWKKSDNLLGIGLVLLIDLQLITGLALYFILSPVMKIAFADFGTAMKDPNLRFYAVEHISMMVIAAILIHISRYKSKRAKTDLVRFRIGSILLFISLVVLIIAIP
jgi:hypothetical protein